MSGVEVRALEAVFEADPKNRRALLALAGHHLEAGASDKVDRLLARYLSTVSGGPAALQALLRSASSPEAPLRAGLLVRLAGMQLYRLSDPRGARSTAQTALKVQPDQPEAQAIIDTVEADEGSGAADGPPILGRVSGPKVDDDPKTQPGARAPDFSEFEATLGGTTNPEIETGEIELGEVTPGEDTGAITAIASLEEEGDLTQATPFAEADPEIVRTCDRLLARPMEASDRLSALHALERSQEGGAERAAVHQALSRAYEAGGDRDRGFYSLVRAARLAVPSRWVLDELFRLAMLTGAFAELSAVYEDNLGGPLAPADRTYLHLKLGHLYSRELARPDAARAHYDRVLQIDEFSNEALTRLAELHAASERWTELVQIRERELVLARADSDLAAQARTQRELARIYEEHLDAPQKAIEQYQSILSVLPDNPAAISGLARLAAHTENPERRETALRSLRASLEAAGRWDELAEQLAEQAASLVRAGEQSQAVRHYLDAASIHLHRRGDGERALIELMRATRAHGERTAESTPNPESPSAGPTTSELLEALIAAGRAAGSLPQAVAVAEDLLDRVETQERSNLSLRLVDLELAELDRPEAAVDRALALLEKSSDPAHWLEPIESRFMARSLWEPLARFYEGAAAQAPSGSSRRSELLFRLAEIQESELREVAAARATYQRILRGEPASLPALDAFMRLCAEAGDEAAPRQMLGDLISTELEEAPRTEWHLRRARLLAAEGDEAGARADFSAVLELDTQNVEALEGLAEAAEDEDELKERARALDERLRRLKPGASERLEGFRHLAALYGPGRLERPEKEREAWEAVRDEASDDHGAFEGLRRLYRTGGESEALVDLLAQALEKEPRHEASREWRRELALSLRKLGRAGEVVQLWQTALRYDPASTEALGELVAHHTARKHWDEVARLLSAWLDAEPDRQKKADLWVQLARIRGPMLEDLEGAEVALGKALALRPDHPAAFGLLLEQFRTGGALRKLFRLLEDRLGQVSRPQERAPLLRELWEVGQGLREEGSVEAGLRSTEALEELALLSPEDDHLWEALAESMAGVALAPDLAGLLEARAARLEDRRRAATLAAAARAWGQAHGRVGDRAGARARRCLERARDAAPVGDPVAIEVRQELRVIYADSGAWEALAAVLEELAGEAFAADAATREAAMEELAYTLQERLGRPAEAARWLERMIEVGADEDREEQLIRLGGLEAGLGRWDQVYELLVRRLRLPHNQTEEKALRLEAAEVGWKRLGAPAKAIGHLRAALALDPDDESLLSSLEQACGEAGRIGEFSAILSEEAALTGDASRRADRLVRAGAIKERQVGDLAGARRDYQAALSAAPETGPLRQAARDGLARTLSAQRDFQGLAELYRGWLEEVPDPETRADLCLALGLIHEDQLDDPDRALANYRRALESDPEDVGILDAVARVAEAQGDLETALKMRTRQAAQVEAPSVLTRLHATLGRLQEGLGDDEGATDAYRRAIELDPDALEARRALVSLLERRKQWEPMIGAARALAVATRDENERADLWSLVGRTLETAGKTGQALAAYEHALAAVPDHPLAALAVARNRGGRNPTESLHALDQAIARLAEAGNTDGLVEALAAAAELATTSEQTEAASSYFDQALRQASPGRDALHALADALMTAERHGDAARCFARLIREERADVAEDEVARAEAIHLRLDLGRCYLTLERADDAVDALRAALVFDPGHQSVLEAMADAFEVAGRWEEVVEVLATLRALEPDPRRARNTTIEMAEICASQLGDAERAAAVLEEGLEKSPDDLEILDRLTTEQMRAGHLELACRAAVQLLSLSRGPRARGRASLRLASLLARLPGRESEVPILLRDAMSHASLIALREEAVTLGRELASRNHDGSFLTTVLEIRLETERGSAYEAALLRELAETRRYHQHDAPGAIRALEELLELEPDDAKALEDLGRLYEGEALDQKAIQVYRRLFLLQPFDPVAREGLRRRFEEAENEDGARLALALEEVFDEASAESHTAHETLQSSALAATGALDPMTRTQGLYPEALRGLSGELARTLGHEAARAALAVLRGAATSEANSDGAPDLPELRETLEWAAERLALPIPHLAGAPAGSPFVLEPSRNTPGLLLVSPEQVAACTPAELRFCVGRALMLSNARSAPAVCLDPVEIRTLFNAAILVAGSEAARAGYDDAERLARALIEAVPLARHATLVRAATRFRAESQLPVTAYFEAVHQAALRGGLLLAGSPVAALHALQREGKVARSTLRELVVFSLAPEHLELRLRLGMARG